MKSETKFVVSVALIVASLAAGIYLRQGMLSLMFVIPIMGVLGLIAWRMLDLEFEVGKQKVYTFVSNLGHFSFRIKDTMRIPIISTDDSGRNRVSGYWRVVFSGGGDFWGFIYSGKTKDPIFIFPDEHHLSFGKNIVTFTILSDCKFRELDANIKESLVSYCNEREEFKRSERLKENETPIFWGIASNIDDSTVNLDLERSMRAYNKEIDALKERESRLIERIRSDKSITEPETIKVRKLQDADDYREVKRR